VFPLDPPAEGGLVGVEDEVPDRNGMPVEARADLAPVLLDQDGHGDHQGAAGVVEHAAGGFDDERRTPVNPGSAAARARWSLSYPRRGCR
jgi:hypothetical protein